MIYPPGIIHPYLPEKNKYTDFKNIDTIVYSEVSDMQFNRFFHLISSQYLQNKDNVFSPKEENIKPYFYGHNTKSFFSFYNEEHILTDHKQGTVITDKKPIGCITSRPIHVFINNGDKDAVFEAYYVDYLCVDSFHRKKGIAPQLIQTHHYNQRHVQKNIVVSLFKREEELTGIVPLCVYKTYGFSVNTWSKPDDLLSMYHLLEINATNIHFLYDFIKTKSSQFKMILHTEISNMVELIKSHNIFIYVVMFHDNILCAYFYRKTCIQIKKDTEVLTCFASINHTEDPLFIHGFKLSFWKIANEKNFGFAAIENISHNHIIIKNICKKTKPSIISPTAYFFYNFAYHTIPSQSVLLIN